jgi:hypothetical protein
VLHSRRMNFDVGLLDRLFGKRVTIEAPAPDGRTRSVSVTEKWLEQQRRAGKITPIAGEMVLVHVVDPVRGQYDVHWRIGKDVPRETYERFYDKNHLAMFALVAYEQGQPRVAVVAKPVYDQMLNL